MRVRIVIFVKAPLPGLAKTRLIPALGATGAAELARRMLLHTLDQVLAAQLGPVELCVTPHASDAVWNDYPLPAGLDFSDQGEGDLGERMARAAERSLHQAEPLLLIGTDCPALNAARLNHAAMALRHVDSTLTPTADGGYALLGLNCFHPSLFNGIAWSSDQVATTTLQRLRQLGWSVQINSTLHDIDQPEDLRWLPPDWLPLPVGGDR